MKVSKYNVYLEECDNLFVYNTLSGGVLQLNSEYAKKFKQIKDNSELCDSYSDLVENLQMGQMLIADTLNEDEMIITHNNMIRFSNAIYTLTIAPTMKCNFVCPYCYEVNKSYPEMDYQVVNRLKELFKEKSELHKFFSIAWYGGEPLLAFDIIKELSKEAINIYGDNYQACMITNGYLFNDEIIKELSSLHIFDIQITLDGPPEIHNIRRKLPSGKDTFFVILDNIKKIIELTDRINITIRVNTDKDNIKYIDEILYYLDKYSIRKKVGLYLAPVDNINNTCNGSICLDTIEFAREQLNFVKRNLERGYNYFNLPHSNLGICGSVAAYNYVIDALGDVYKCWDDIACQERRLGNILDDEDSWMNENLTNWLTYDIREDKECMDCPYLPVCMGGCPNYRLRNKSKKCLPIKENSKDLIKVLYELSLQKAEDIINISTETDSKFLGNCETSSKS